MRILLTSDWHITSRQPSYLKTDVFELTVKKIEWLMGLEFDVILNAGDIFETPYGDQTFINWCLENLPEMFTIPGNHDLPVRNPLVGIKRSVYWTMVAAEHFIDISGMYEYSDTVSFCGIPFSGSPRIGLINTKVNILAVHRPVFKKAVPFWMAEKGVTAKELAREFDGFDLILSGDIHESWFVRGKSGRYVVNGGGLFYEYETQPDKFVFIFDTNTKELELIKIPLVEEFITKTVVTMGEKNVELFVKYIEGKEVTTTDYLGELRKVANDPKLEKGVKTELEEILNEVTN